MKCIVPPNRALPRTVRRRAAGLTLASALALALADPAAAQRAVGEPTNAVPVSLMPVPESGGPLATPPLSVLPPYSPGSAAALVGVNLLGGGYTSENQMFVDAMRTALRWRDPNNLYGGAPVPTDANGWPTADAGIFVVDGTLAYNWNFSDGVRNQRGPEMGGIWKLSFECANAAVVQLQSDGGTFQNVVRDTANGRVTADFVLPAGRFQNAVLRFRQTSGGVRNVRLLRPGYSLTNTPTFTDAYKQMLGPFGVLRFMGPLNTNSAPAYPAVTSWSERTLPAQNQNGGGAGRGIAWEYVTQLATETGKDVWINVPIAANDDYVTNLAAFLHDRLPPTAKVYLEYSNEVWNGGFAQAAWNRSAAIAEVSGEGPFDQNVGDWRDDPNNQTYWGYKRVARRLIQVSRIFRQAFGETGVSVQSPAARVRPVLASQTGNPYVLDLQLLYTERYFGPPSDYFYGVAGAPYFALGGIASSTTLTVDQILNQFRASIDGEVRTGMRSFTTMASFYGLRSLVYEGGPDDVASASDPVGYSQQAKYDAQYDPRMAGIVGDYLKAWGTGGGDLFMYFGDCSGFTRYGPWGLTEDPNQLNVPKYTGLLSFMAGAQPAMTAGTRLSSDGPAFTAAPEFAESIGGRAAVNTSAATPYLSGITPITHFDYLLNVAETGIYRVSVEALTANANITGGTLQVRIGGAIVGPGDSGLPAGTYRVAQGNPAAAAWPATTEVPVTLTAGKHGVRLQTVAVGTTPPGANFTLYSYGLRRVRFVPTGAVSIAPLVLGSYAADATLVPLTVQVRTPGTTTAAETRQAYLRPDGTLRFLSLQRGTFDVSVKGGTFLRKTYAGVSLTDAGVTLAGVTMVNGDVNGDNAVGSADLSLVYYALNSTPGSPRWRPEADVNGDGRVDQTDYDVVRANYYKRGDR